MWFKQISFYPLNMESLAEVDTVADKLQDAVFPPIMGLERFSEGFAAPNNFSSQLVFTADFTWSVMLKRAEKVLPAAVIRDILEEKVQEIEDNEGRKVGKKEKNELKEQITDDLLPRAFIRSSAIHAVCDTRNGLILVNTASVNKAENMLTRLRDALGSLEVHLPNTQQSPTSLMTHWLLQGSASGGFELDHDCELRGQGDVVPIVKVSKQDLTAAEVVEHVRMGKMVTQLGLIWRNQIAFILTSDFTFKRVQYLDILQEEADNYGEDEASLAFASQILMVQSISEMVQELVAHLGGWQK